MKNSVFFLVFLCLHLSVSTPFFLSFIFSLSLFFLSLSLSLYPFFLLVIFLYFSFLLLSFWISCPTCLKPAKLKNTIKHHPAGEPAGMYICRTAGCGTALFRKPGRFGVHLKAGLGPTRVSHYENRHLRGKVWRLRNLKGQNVTSCPPHGARALFCRNTNLNLCTGLLGANPLWQGVALVKIGFLGGRIVQGFCACTNLKISVYRKCLLLHFAKLCALIFWNACFGSLIAFWAVRDFRRDFWAVSNLEAIWLFSCCQRVSFLPCPVCSS